MTPMTPIIDTPTGRLAELVHLLADAPLSTALGAVETAANGRASSAQETVADPLWIVAGALVHVRKTKDDERRSTADEERIPLTV